MAQFSNVHKLLLGRDRHTFLVLILLFPLKISCLYGVSKKLPEPNKCQQNHAAVCKMELWFSGTL